MPGREKSLRTLSIKGASPARSLIARPARSATHRPPGPQCQLSAARPAVPSPGRPAVPLIARPAAQQTQVASSVSVPRQSNARLLISLRVSGDSQTRIRCPAPWIRDPAPWIRDSQKCASAASHRGVQDDSQMRICCPAPWIRDTKGRASARAASAPRLPLDEARPCRCQLLREYLALRPRSRARLPPRRRPSAIPHQPTGIKPASAQGRAA